ncbi:hypothetical protein BHE74_00042719 [Ensete ventricosum]|nr:hypothetical protein BHE74_00042719 [Ensete ventricosum]
MRVDFPRWEGDLTRWLLRVECYFHYHRTPEASMVDIATIHLEGDTIQCCNHRCKKWKLLMIDPIKEPEREEEDLEHEEENTMEDLQSADCTTHTLAGYANPQIIKFVGFLKQQPITIPIETRSTNNFMNNKVATQLMLQNEDCSRVDVKVADDRILKCDQRCPRVKLLLQDQEIIADFILLSLDDYDAALSIEWLTTLGDIF